MIFLKKLGTYDFTFDVYRISDVNLTSNSMIDNIINEIINGNLEVRKNRN